MEELKKFHLLQRLTIQAPRIGILTHTAICAAIADKKNLEELQIEYLEKKYDQPAKKPILDLDGLPQSFIEAFYEGYVEDAINIKRIITLREQ